MPTNTVQTSIDNLRTKIAGAFNNVLNQISALDSAKLDATNNFDNTGSGLSATTLAAAVVELKGLIDALDATYATDAETAANIQAVNDAWAAADSNITMLVNGKLDASAYTGADVISKLNAEGIDFADFITVNDQIDLGELT